MKFETIEGQVLPVYDDHIAIVDCYNTHTVYVFDQEKNFVFSEPLSTFTRIGSTWGMGYIDYDQLKLMIKNKKFNKVLKDLLDE